jgi:FkbM family methyltransferase
MAFPELSVDELRRNTDRVASEFAAGRRERALIEVLGCSPTEAIGTRRFVVLGSQHRSEIRVLARLANIAAIVDDALARDSQHLMGCPVVTTDAWVEMVRKDPSIISCLLISTPNGYLHFVRAAVECGARILMPVPFLELLRSIKADTKAETGRFFWYGYGFLQSTVHDLPFLHQMADKLADHASKYAWYSVLLYRLTLNPFYLHNCGIGHNMEKYAFNSYSCNRTYFQFTDDETYVDGGAFTGDTAEQFIRAVGGQFDRIYSFEPATSHHHSIRERVKAMRDTYLFKSRSRFVLSDRGLWNETTTLTFNPGQIADPESGGPINTQSAHLVDTGILSHIYNSNDELQVSVKVPVTTIDEATEQSATFIKLEIEGAELAALQGAKRTIARKRPKMALSVYHKPEDLRTISAFVIEQDMGYRFGFRQHNALVPDAMVLYCH